MKRRPKDWTGNVIALLPTRYFSSAPVAFFEQYAEPDKEEWNARSRSDLPPRRGPPIGSLSPGGRISTATHVTEMFGPSHGSRWGYAGHKPLFELSIELLRPVLRNFHPLFFQLLGDKFWS
jgi:hypothetical protein